MNDITSDRNNHPIYQETFGDPRIPDGLVDKFYIMNPAEEDLIPYGDQLRDGMVVLLEHYGLRRSFEDQKDQAAIALLYERNQWCRVMDLDITNDRVVRFTGIYHDGVKIRRQYHRNNPWLVKLDSLPNGEPLWTNRVKRWWKMEKGTDIR